MALPHTIETDGRQAGANQHMVLAHTIETDGRRPHNKNRWPHNSRATAFCHAWPILLFGVVSPFYPLLTYYAHTLIILCSRSFCCCCCCCRQRELRVGVLSLLPYFFLSFMPPFPPE